MTLAETPTVVDRLESIGENHIEPGEMPLEQARHLASLAIVEESETFDPTFSGIVF